MDEGPDKAPRRKRVSRACDRCRSKKVSGHGASVLSLQANPFGLHQDKCDGIRPTCSACQTSGQICSYDPHARKRGLPEGYVRGLEKLWALSICNIDGFEEAMLAMLGTTAESAERRDKLMSVWTNDTSSESLHETWKSSRLYGVLERMLSNSEAPPSAPGKRSRSPHEVPLDRPKGQWELRVARDSSPLGTDAPRIVDPRGLLPGMKRPRVARPSAVQDASQSVNGPDAALELPPQTSQLLDIYFAETQLWLPIIAKHNILRASFLYVNAPISVATVSRESGDHAALWAILSYTITQSRTDLCASPAGAVDLAKEYYAISRNLIPSEKERYELGHIQALLLLTLVNMALEDWAAAWLLSGQAVRMSIAMGLNTVTDTRPPHELRGKAVFLGCFVLDSMLSFRLMRCPAMSPNDLAITGLLEEDGLEEWNSWTDVLCPSGAPQGKNCPRKGPLLALSCFNRLVELASAFNRISRNLSMGHTGVSFAQQLVLDLKRWDNGLPLGCRLIGPESIYPERHSALLPHQSYLGLTYVAALLWLYLRLIRAEQGLHRSQRPATEGAKKLLYRALSMLSQHLENFPTCGFPPVLEIALRTIFEQASTLRQTLDSSDTFPFARWAEEFRRNTRLLTPTRPIYGSLDAVMERWHERLGFEEASPSAFSGTTPGPILPAAPMADSMQPSGNTHSLLARDAGHYTTSVLGISIPVDTQSTTTRDTVMGNTDPAMMDVPPLQHFEADTGILGKIAPRKEPDAIYPPSTGHLQPATPDSATSNLMITGKALASESPATTCDKVAFNAADTGDLDAIFKDLAYLDTTEWSNNREAGLKDFGFLDESTFHAFCHDPDRLGGSQPLVHPPSIADIWPPPGFFPETFQEATEKTVKC